MREVPLWKQALKTNFVHWEELADFLELSTTQKAQILSKPSFVLNLPLRLAAKIEKGNLKDPLLLQFLPTLEEARDVEGFISDPVGDLPSSSSKKLLQKYQGRALLVTTSACAMHCRFCFRQNFPYDRTSKSFEEEIQLIKQDSSLHEVILSGGDPLSLNDDLLSCLLQQLNKIPHIRRIRFHTRFPIGIPERIDEHFLQMIQRIGKQIWFVIHVNHPREFDNDIWEVLANLRKMGTIILNQSTLLAGVNDDVKTLKELSEALVDHGVVPYYLHHLDRVKGAAHFEVPEKKGLWLIEELRKQISGYAVPTYVREIAGEPSKTPI